MPKITPAQFPHIQRTSVQQTHRTNAAGQTNQVQPQKPATITKQPVQTPQKSAVTQANGIKTRKDETLEIAIEVLQRKTLQLYHPNKTKAKQQPAALGQIIDIRA